MGALAAKDLPNQPPPPRLELLRQLLEGGDRPVGSLALRREQRLEAGGRLVGPLPLGRLTLRASSCISTYVEISRGGQNHWLLAYASASAVVALSSLGCRQGRHGARRTKGLRYRANFDIAKLAAMVGADGL